MVVWIMDLAAVEFFGERCIASCRPRDDQPPFLGGYRFVLLGDEGVVASGIVKGHAILPQKRGLHDLELVLPKDYDQEIQKNTVVCCWRARESLPASSPHH